jgi:threonine/homoserine/homoserine lactone efflux protein
MISQPEFSYFIIASLLLILSPGPDIISLITQSFNYGAKAGFLTALGLASGNLVHTAAAALGVTIIIQTSEIAFASLKFIGVGYLLYLAYRLLSSCHLRSANKSQVKANNGYTSFYKTGLLINVLNPKIALLFLALLPQFVPSASTQQHLDIIFLGISFATMVAIIFGGISLLVPSINITTHLKSVSYNIFARVNAAIFILLAINLALSSQK